MQLEHEVVRSGILILFGNQERLGLADKSVHVVGAHVEILEGALIMRL